MIQLIHVVTLAAMLSAPPPNSDEEASPVVDAPEARGVPDSVWAALLDHRVEVRSNTGDVLRGKLLSHDSTNVVLTDDDGGVTAHSKDTIVAVRIDELTPSGEPSADDAGPRAAATAHEAVEDAQVTSAASAPECRVDGECDDDGICRLGACVAPEPQPDRTTGRRLEWAGMGVLAGGVATAAGVGTWLWTSGYRSYQEAREDYYGSNGICNTTWDPCGSRSEYSAAKRAADMRINAGIAAVAVGSVLVVSGVVMAIVGGVRAKQSRRRHAAFLPSWEHGAGGMQWTVYF
jgi:hypothetical protein